MTRKKRRIYFKLKKRIKIHSLHEFCRWTIPSSLWRNVVFFAKKKWNGIQQKKPRIIKQIKWKIVFLFNCSEKWKFFLLRTKIIVIEQKKAYHFSLFTARDRKKIPKIIGWCLFACWPKENETKKNGHFLATLIATIIIVIHPKKSWLKHVFQIKQSIPF